MSLLAAQADPVAVIHIGALPEAVEEAHIDSKLTVANHVADEVDVNILVVQSTTIKYSPLVNQP